MPHQTSKVPYVHLETGNDNASPQCTQLLLEYGGGEGNRDAGESHYFMPNPIDRWC
jgi:hypothetical protein